MENTNGWQKDAPDDDVAVDGAPLFGHITIECRASREGNMLAIICDEHGFLQVARVPEGRVGRWAFGAAWSMVGEHLAVEHAEEIAKMTTEE